MSVSLVRVEDDAIWSKSSSVRLLAFRHCFGDLNDRCMPFGRTRCTDTVCPCSHPAHFPLYSSESCIPDKTSLYNYLHSTRSN